MGVSNNTNTKGEFELIKDQLRNCINHWYYFVVSLIVCMALGFVHYKMADSVWDNQAKVAVLPDESLGGSISKSSSLMGSLGLGSSSGINIEDESNKMGSYGSMRQIITNLKLNNDYKLKKFGGLVKKDLYNNSPIEISYGAALPDTLLAILTFDISEKDGAYTIKMKAFKDKMGTYKLASLPGTIQTPYGEFTFEKTPFYDSYDDPIKLQITVFSYNFRAQAFAETMLVDFEKKNSSIMTLGIQDINTRRACDMLNEAIKVYNYDWTDYKGTVSKRTLDFIESQIKATEEALTVVDKQIEVFKTDAKLTDPIADATVILEQGSAVQEKLLEAKINQTVANITWEFMNDPENENSPIPFSFSGGEDKSLSEAIAGYNRILQEKNEIMKNTTGNNTRLESLTDKLNMQRVNLLRTLDNFKKGLDVSLDLVKKKESEINKWVEGAPAIEKKYIELKREQELQQSVYIFLLEKRMETTVKSVSFMPRLKVIDEPHAVIIPVSPNLKKIVVIVFFIGGILIPISAIALEPYILRRRKENND